MIGNLKTKWNEDEYFRKAIVVFLIVKIILFSVGAAGQFIPEDMTNRQMRDDNFFLNGWAQYDAAAYVDIAQNGYNQNFAEGRGNYGWFPLYPFLILLLSFLGFYLSGFLISNVSSLIAVVLLYSLVKDELGGRAAYLTVVLMALFPTAYFFNAVYTESLFLLETVAFFWFARKEQYGKAGIMGFLAALTRTQGIVLFLPALYFYYKKNKFNIKIGRELLPLVLIPFGIAAMLFYHFAITGDPFIQFSTHTGFEREITLPFSSIMHSVNTLFYNISVSDLQGTFYQSFNLFILTFFSVLLYYSYRLLDKRYFIYFLFSLLLPLFSARLEAISRFYLVIFPAFMALAVLSQDERKNLVIKTTYLFFILLSVLFTIRHVNEDIFLTGIF